jgi:hypothetical protein
MAKRLTEDQKERIHELHAEHPDWSQRRIAEVIGCSQQAVALILNPEIAERQRMYSANRSEQYNKRRRDDRAANPEPFRARRRAYYAENSEHILAWQRATFAANPERLPERDRRFRLKYPLYGVWTKMKARCNNPDLKNYSTYGGRGIRVCARWNGPKSYPDFEADVLAAIGPRPDGVHPSGRMPLYTLDRIDNDGNYSCGQCPECVANGWSWNVRWASAVEQNTNTRPQLAVTEVPQLRAELAERDTEIERLRAELARLNRSPG